MFDKAFWDRKYLNLETGWDIGYPSPPIITFMERINDKSSRILIPGAGNAYEATHLCANGFVDVTVIDISSIAVKNLKKRMPENAPIKVIEGDFFKHKGQYDIIIEQTFFCSLQPDLRQKYVEQMFALLSTKGFIIGVLFDVIFEKPGPPFGGSKNMYIELFSPHFNIEHMAPCYNSISPRKGNELFIKLLKNPGFI